MLDHGLDEQIAGAQAELGFCDHQQVQQTSISFKILHYVGTFKSTNNPKPNTPSSSTTNNALDSSTQDYLEEPEDDLGLALQIAEVKAELNRVQLEGEHRRHRGELQRKKSQDNLKEKTRTLNTRMRQQRKAPDCSIRRIVKRTFNDPSRNPFCVDMEIKNVHGICNMWWMNRQLVLQLDALDDLDELLDSERTKYQDEAHKNRAQLIMLTKIPPPVDNLKYQAEVLLDDKSEILMTKIAPPVDNLKYQAEVLDDKLEILKLKRQQFAAARKAPPPRAFSMPPSPRTARKQLATARKAPPPRAFSLPLASPSPRTVVPAVTARV
jgi:hypothetical protein